MLSADAGGLEIDSCRRCQLLWFDRGEAPEPEPRATLAPEEAAAAVRAEADGDQGVEAAPPFALRRILGLLGLPVEIDAPVRGIVPWATIGMGIVLIVVGLLTLGDRVTSALYGFLPSRPFRSHGATLLTYFFLHANLLHLFGNAYFLAVFGDNVEEAAGRARFLAMTLAGSAAGAILHGLFEPARDVPLIGASAGVSAILVYYVFRFPRARIGWFVFTLPAWGYGLVWAGIQFTDAVAQATGQSNVSAFAHIGGAAVGVAFFAVARRMGSWNSADAQRL
jgi:membrane associated rhomboid family serine protease